MAKHVDDDRQRTPRLDRRSALKLAGTAGLAGFAAAWKLPALAAPEAAAALRGAAAAPGGFTPIRPPATPLAVRSMYLSTWLPGDNLAGTWPSFWNGHVTALTGIARIDGAPYVFAGNPSLPAGPALALMTQVALTVTATASHYILQGGGVQLDVVFFSPVAPDHLQRQSVPMSYVTVQASSIDGRPHRVSLYLDISGEWAHGDVTQPITWTRQRAGEQMALTCTPANPGVLAEFHDQASWGTVVFAADAQPGLTWQIGQDTVVRAAAATAGVLDGSVDSQQPRAINDAWPVFGFNLDLGAVTGPSRRLVACLGHVRTPAISYLGTSLSPWWQTYWPDWQAMLRWFRHDLEPAQAQARQLEARLAQDVRHALGDDATARAYLALCSLALRQTFGGTELVNRNGAPWAFLKEISSDGNVSTVDVTYPAFPAYLYASPSYLKLLLAPLFDYAEHGGWPKAFAEHDLGSSYPNATGHNDGKEEDMPVEESANMLIMTAALLGRLPAAEAAAYAKAHYPILKQWADYLVDNALDPGYQNQTDDFTGFIAHSVNLALKGIIGIGAMGQIATAAGHGEDATRYAATARDYIAQWQSKGMDSSGQHMKLAYDQDGTWSLKYNGYPDRLLGTQLIPESVAALEAAWYAARKSSYGVELDPRNTYTKLDWELWTAAWLSGYPIAKALIADGYNYAGHTANRVPLSDWYQVASAAQAGFQARPVVGGLFALLTLPQAPGGGAKPQPSDAG